MKLHTLTAIFSAALLSTLPSQAQTPEQKPQPPNAPAIPISKNVTIRATIVALKNVEATAFSAKQDLSGKPAEALDTLEKLVAQQKALSVANVSVTTTSGQRALSDSGKITLEVEPILSEDGKIYNINLVVNDNGHNISSNIQVSNGGTKFIGSVQSPTDKTMTDYIFVRVSF
jgi:hypothetical protein